MDLRHSKATLISLGAVDTTGVPVMNQVARFFDADTVQGSANFTFSGTILALTGNMTISSFLAFGGTPALSGTIRLSNEGSIVARNGADDGDIELLSLNESNQLDLGTSAVGLILAAAPAQFSNVFTVLETDPNAFRVRGGSPTTNQFNVDTTNNEITFTAHETAGGGAETKDHFAKTTVLTPSGATATAAGLIPAGAIVLGVTTRVITLVTGPAGFDVGDGVNTDRWGNSIAVALGTTSDPTDFVSGALEIFPVANDVVISSDGVDFTGGEIRITVHYKTLVAPTA